MMWLSDELFSAMKAMREEEVRRVLRARLAAWPRNAVRVGIDPHARLAGATGESRVSEELLRRGPPGCCAGSAPLAGV